MFDFLDRLREGSEFQRQRFALIVSFSLTGIVFVGWMMSLAAGTGVYTQSEAASTSPLAAVKDAVRQGGAVIRDIRDIIAESRAVFTYTASSSSKDTLGGVSTGSTTASSTAREKVN